MLFYHIWTLPILTNIYVAEKKQRMADTHLSIETTYVHSLSNKVYYDAPQYAFPQGRRSSATT